MISFPNSKINLGLRVVRKRPDGFHDLETVFYPLPLRDVLEIVPGKTTAVQVSGHAPDIPSEENICYKAWQLLRAQYPDLPEVAIHLYKAIPSGAGLGGGSADGAFALDMLNRKYRLGCTHEQLADFALQLGSDCPFFLLNTPCIGNGRGEILERIAVDLSDYQLVVVNPGIAVPTGWAFSRIRPAQPEKPIREIIRQPISTWRSDLVNDFEPPLMKEYPELDKIKQTLYQEGAVYAAMSGSGSTIFGIFSKVHQPKLNFPDHWLVRTLDCQL